ncbi:MAG TPA: hypothetical protein VFF17_15890, partial [Thermoanaerobaculia bacterium]|nr:hypothetical protein [Thermoanaerobaculia bacterium]
MSRDEIAAKRLPYDGSAAAIPARRSKSSGDRAIRTTFSIARPSANRCPSALAESAIRRSAATSLGYRRRISRASRVASRVRPRASSQRAKPSRNGGAPRATPIARRQSASALSRPRID